MDILSEPARSTSNSLPLVAVTESIVRDPPTFCLGSRRMLMMRMECDRDDVAFNR